MHWRRVPNSDPNNSTADRYSGTHSCTRHSQCGCPGFDACTYGHACADPYPCSIHRSNSNGNTHAHAHAHAYPYTYTHAHAYPYTYTYTYTYTHAYPCTDT